MPLNLEIMQIIINAILYILASFGLVFILGSIVVFNGIRSNSKFSKQPDPNTPSSH